ncbi:MAG: acetyl-CoA C-acyltransferase [Actinomycetota bacterium]|nr:acetyl-CoA C-acyltransferase [Actinomycetota bacterium]
MDVYVVDACRTPIGRFRGAVSGVRPDDLAGLVVGEVCRRNPAVDPAEIADVAFGAANQAGEDNRNVARMAVLLAGLPLTVPGVTLNRLCGSGLEAVNHAAANLAMGNGDVALGGGVESMSRAPWVMPKPDERLPRRQELADTALGWRIVNPKMPEEHTVSLGMTAEVLAEEYAISREAQDTFALGSHTKALAAIDAGAFDDELVPVETADGTVERDEGPRADSSMERLAKLKPVFAADGSVTAGNSSPLNDGAAAVMLASGAGVERLGLEPIVRIVGWAVAGVEPRRMGIGPAPALRLALERADWKLSDLSVVELNEAFAAQSLAVLAELGLDEAVVNPLGGAIALGHPLGCSGARILTTLVHQLADQPAGTRGAATMCIGVGQGIATLVERV